MPLCASTMPLTMASPRPARPVSWGGAGVTSAPPGVEDPAQFRFGDAATGVGDGDRRRAAGVGRRGYGYGAVGRGVLDGVVQQVRERPGEFAAVSVQVDVWDLIAVYQDVTGSGGGGDVGDGVADQVVQGHVGERQD